MSYAYFVAFFEQLFYILLLFVEGSSGHKVSYAYFVAFISLLRNMELIKKVYLNATNGSRTAELTKVCLTTEFLRLFFLKGSELQCCGSGSGIRCLFDSWVRSLFSTPGSGIRDL